MNNQFQLSPQDKAHLSVLLPAKLLEHSDSLSILACYGNSSFPATALHYLERCQWHTDQPASAEASLVEIESVLSTRRLWRALRDVYVRAMHHPAFDAERRADMRNKALLLSLYHAPHPTTATHVILHAIDAWTDGQRDPWMTESFFQQIIGRCIKLGWLEQLRHWLQALDNAGHTFSQHQELLDEINARSHSPTPTPSGELDALQVEVQSLQQQAAACHAPEDARQRLIQAARALSSSVSTHQQAADAWHQLLQQMPDDHLCWQGLYEATIPTKLWDLLSRVLCQLPTRNIQLPRPPRLRLPLLLALEQRALPEFDPLPLLLVAFQQNPMDHRRFQNLFQTLQEERRWHLLRRVLSLRLTYLCIPSLHSRLEQGAQSESQSNPGHKLPDQAQAHLAALLDTIQRTSPNEQSLLFSVFTQAMAFAPHEDALLSQLAQWSYEQPFQHPVHDLLRHMALEGRGDTHFQLEIAERLSHDTIAPANPESAEQAIQIYQQILRVDPGQLDALQQSRELAIRQKRYEDALSLFVQECKYQKDKERRVLLLLQMASLLSSRLHRYDEAIDTCQEALRIQPQHKQALRSMAALLEHQQQYQRLLPILGQLLPLLDAPPERRAVLRKLTRFALYPARDHTTVLRALQDLLLQPQTTAECLDALEQLLQLPKAQNPLLSFLLEQEQSVSDNAKPYIQLLIIRLMFRLLRFQEARSRLKHFLQDATEAAPSVRLLLLQRCEEVAIEYHAWRELAETLQAQISLLQVMPHALPSLGSLHLRYAEVCHHLLNDQQAAQRAYLQAILYEPQSTDAHEPMLQWLFERKAYNEGCQLLQAQAERLPPAEGATIFTRIAHIQREQLQRTDLAIQSLGYALELNPHHAPALQVLTQLQSGV